jgi:hypothetical protein
MKNFILVKLGKGIKKMSLIEQIVGKHMKKA